MAVLAASRSSSRYLPDSTTFSRLSSSIFNSPYRRAFCACRLSELACRVTSSKMSYTRDRFCLAPSNLASASRFRVLNLVMPAASSITPRRSCGFELKICPMRPCSMMA